MRMIPRLSSSHANISNLSPCLLATAIASGSVSRRGKAAFRGLMVSIGVQSGLLGTPHNTFSQETIETLIRIAAAKESLGAVHSGALPEQREALETLARFVDTWLGLREHPDHDF